MIKTLFRILNIQQHVFCNLRIKYPLSTQYFFLTLAGGLFEGGLFDDAPMGEVPAVESSSVMGVSNVDQTLESVPPPHHESDDDDDDGHFDGPPSVGGHR